MKMDSVNYRIQHWRRLQNPLSALPNFKADYVKSISCDNLENPIDTYLTNSRGKDI